VFIDLTDRARDLDQLFVQQQEDAPLDGIRGSGAKIFWCGILWW
jgi:hypothetical protein